MRGDDEAIRSPERPSVFGAPDQGDIIARIDATTDDDLASSFFDSSIQDVEDAAVRMFDIGIRTITDDPAAPRGFGTPAAGSSVAVPRVPSAVGQSVAAGAHGWFDDPAARAAFILGGPAAVSA